MHLTHVVIWRRKKQSSEYNYTFKFITVYFRQDLGNNEFEIIYILFLFFSIFFRYWANVDIPHGTIGFQAVCPFCATPLLGCPGYIRLIFQDNLD